MSNPNISLVQNMYAAFGRGDIDALLTMATPDIEWNSGGVKRQYPAFGTHKGPAGVKEFFRTVAETVEFSEFSPREFYGDRDKVFVLGFYAGTIKRNGHKVATEWLMVFTLRDGKVAKFREFTDTYAVEEAYSG